MTMKVETFEIEEITQEIEQQSAEAIALCEQLGLKGQLKQDSETMTTVRCPYRLMKNDEKFVYSVLCPDQTNVEVYTDPIPLEVLKTLAYAKSLGVFKTFRIWAASTKSVRDPVLVGYPGEYYSNKEHILARWGEELLPLEVLVPDAIRRWFANRIDHLTDIKAQVELELSKPAPQGIPSKVGYPTFYV